MPPPPSPWSAQPKTLEEFRSESEKRLSGASRGLYIALKIKAGVDQNRGNVQAGQHQLFA